MSEDNQKKTFLILTVFISLVAVSLTVASFSTDNWVKYAGTKANNTGCRNGTNQRCFVEGRFGLFRGEDVINYRFGDRSRLSQVICTEGWCMNYAVILPKKINTTEGKEILKVTIKMYENSTDKDVEPWQFGIFRFGYWVTVLVFLSIGIVWGLVTIGFTIFNIFGKPIETVTGPLGLYLWNFLALIFSLIGVVIYVVLFQANFAESVLSRDDYQATFITKNDTALDYSFYFTIGSLVGYLLNLVLLMLSGYRLRCGCTQEANKAIDNGIILY